MENLKLKKILANVFETGLMEVDDIIKINFTYLKNWRKLNN